MAKYRIQPGLDGKCSLFIEGDIGEWSIVGSSVFFDIDITDPKPPKRSKWHRVEDEMPDSNRDVQILVDDSQSTAWWDKDCWRDVLTWATLNQEVAKNITHWRELPKPPKERDE